jgi:hypothetical protein
MITPVMSSVAVTIIMRPALAASDAIPFLIIAERVSMSAIENIPDESTFTYYTKVLIFYHTTNICVNEPIAYVQILFGKASYLKIVCKQKRITIVKA